MSTPFKMKGSAFYGKSPLKQVTGRGRVPGTKPWGNIRPLHPDVTKSFKGAGKIVGKLGKFLGSKALGVASLVLGPTKTATADQPTFPKGSAHYQDPKKKIKFGK